MSNLNSEQLVTGSRLSEMQFYTVVDPHATDSRGRRVVKVKNESGMELYITPDIVDNCMWSSDQFETTEKVSRTRLAEIFSQAHGAVFTANFNKKVDKDELETRIKEIVKARPGGQVESHRAFEARFDAAVPDLTRGQERTLTGYLISSDNMGRSKVIDLAIEGKNNIRQVDHRTLNWVIYKGVKYVVKK